MFTRSFWVRAGLAASVGALAAMSWAPLSIWPLALAGYGVLLRISYRATTPIQAAVFGMAFGVSLHAAGDGWVFSSMHDLMNMTAVVALAGSAVFVVYLSLFTAIPNAVWWYWSGRQSGVLAAAGWAVLMTLGEYARSLPFNGFTSLSLGYALVDTWLLGVAPVLGVYGVGLMGFLVAGFIGTAFTRSWRWHASLAGATLLLLAAALLLNRIDWVSPIGKPLNYRLLQIDVPQSRKFDPAYAASNINELLTVIEARRSDLVITPETVFPVEFSALPPNVVERLQRFSQQSNSHLLIGSGTVAASGTRHNSVIHVSPTSATQQYDRVYLTALGEYTPPGLAWFSREMNILPNDLSPGAVDQPPFEVGTQKIGSLICNEDMTSVRTREWLSGTTPATVLVNPSNLAWFDGSIALAQRQQLVRMRAAESGRPLLRVANTGITAHVDHRGRVVAELPVGRAGELTGSIQGMTGLTPYAVAGDCPILIVAVGVLVGGLVVQRRLMAAVEREAEASRTG